MQQNLMGMLSGLDDFRQIHSKIFNQDQEKQKNEEIIVTINEAIKQISSAKPRDANEIIKEVKLVRRHF